MLAFFRTSHGLVALLFLAFGGFFLITEHAAHTIQWLPWLILLACPLMHVFMHHGHGAHTDHNARRDDDQQDKEGLSTVEDEGGSHGGNHD